MYTFKILTTVDSSIWGGNLTKSDHATFFQTTDYLNSDSKNFFPVFIYVIDKFDNVVGQIGISIIKTTVMYSNSLFQNALKLIANLTRRGIWLSGPIIHSDIKKERLEILQQIITAIDVVCKQYDLVFIEGYTSPYDMLIDEEHIQLFTKNDYVTSNYITFISDLKKPIEQIWQNISKKTRGDVKRAERRNIVAKEIQTIDELKEFLLLHKVWAKTKGLEISDPFQDLTKLWNNHKSGMEKFFLAYEKNKLISALRISCFNGIAYTHFVISSYSKSTSLGGTFLTWFAIKWAKSKGLRLYDFSGGPKLNVKNQDSLLFYKKKWGGNEYSHYNVIKIQKKFHYVLYKYLFGLIKSYHDFKSKRVKSSRDNNFDA